MFSMPSFLINLMPSFKPTIPGIFNVPDSNLSGKKSGWLSAWERLPVPPNINGSHISLSSSLIIKPPIPWGPSKLLWPVKAKALKLNSAKSTGSTPALWALSKIKNILFFLQSSPISFIGWIDPMTLEAWVRTISFVLGFISLLILSTLSIPKLLHDLLFLIYS